ncbi:putative WD repeat-containing protein all2124 [Nostoc sp, PCC 7120] [Rhizoctonia solani]|uniref:Putative WD repeat-containing protein all2124 [Nostoc sp, PCC 7120] n=1 Tax=Rhizoctonia solani TaxID=456999 RepID=A0A0K6GIG0_9AGAM|nr:putative WD repeat-containing protein all2124 [Nostoc sp, PCC 7120] [Rhizoctonia solani]
MRRGCTKGTRVGVLADLDQWLDDPTSPPVCWINGMAGTGKTTIAYTFCETAEKRNLLAASFFCTRSSAECRNVTRIIPTIAYQLAGYLAPYRSALSKVLGGRTDFGSRHVLAQFAQLLKEPLQAIKDMIPNHLVMVIDGVDECEDRSGIARLLDTLFQYSPNVPLKFLITSQPNAEIYAKMSLYRPLRDMIHLDEIDESVVQADIQLYLSEGLEHLFLGPAEMEQLVQRSGKFFIYAATLARYITSGRSIDPHKRLQSILSVAPDATRWHSPIDALYSVVLTSALEAGKPEDIWMVLRTVLLAQEPVNVATIVALAGIEDSRRVLSVLNLLRSVLHHPNTTGLVSTLHASFPDYIFDNERSGPYYCDAAELNRAMAERCFVIMKEQLRFNICNLETSFIFDAQINDMQARVNNMIPSSLAYVCRYWVKHIAPAYESDVLLAMLDEFLCNHLLFWIEVLNVRRETIEGIEGLLKTKQWLKKINCTSNQLVMLVEDARNFITSFAASPASRSTPHIYISSLPFCPRSSLVYKHYWKRMHGLLELNGSLMEHREAIALATWNVTSNILSIACSPSGDQIAVGCFDRTVRLLNALDGVELVSPLEGHTEIAHSVAFSPDGQLVASGSYDGTIRVWNADIGTLVCVTTSREAGGDVSYVNSVAFSPDGRRIASGSAAGIIRVWGANDGALLLGPLEAHSDWIRSVTFSPDGIFIASASDDHTVRLWRSDDGTSASAIFKGHTHWVMSIAFSPDGTRLASGSRDNTIRVWNTSDGSLISKPFEGHTGPVYSVVISSDGTRVASGSGDGTIRIWDIYNGTLAAGPFRLIDYTGSVVLVTSVMFSPDGTRVISSSYNRAIHVWDLRYNDTLASAPTPPQDTIPVITSLAFSSDGAHILSSSPDRTIRLWDTRDGVFKAGPDKGDLPYTSLSRFSPVYSPNRSYFAGSFENDILHIMSMKTGATVTRLQEVDHRSLSAFMFSQDSNTAITGGSTGTIQVWDVQNGQITGHPFVGHTGAVTSIAQSLDCSLLASYSEKDKSLRVWSMKTPIIGSDQQRGVAPALDHNAANIWHITKDGWIVDNNNDIVLWLPADISSLWRSSYAFLIVNERGTLQITKQKLLIGSEWSAAILCSYQSVSPRFQFEPSFVCQSFQ